LTKNFALGAVDTAEGSSSDRTAAVGERMVPQRHPPGIGGDAILPQLRRPQPTTIRP
jgi:hypothetical protein